MIVLRGQLCKTDKCCAGRIHTEGGSSESVASGRLISPETRFLSHHGPNGTPLLYYNGARASECFCFPNERARARTGVPCTGPCEPPCGLGLLCSLIHSLPLSFSLVMLSFVLLSFCRLQCSLIFERAPAKQRLGSKTQKRTPPSVSLLLLFLSLPWYTFYSHTKYFLLIASTSRKFPSFWGFYTLQWNFD